MKNLFDFKTACAVFSLIFALTLVTSCKDVMTHDISKDESRSNTTIFDDLEVSNVKDESIVPTDTVVSLKP